MKFINKEAEDEWDNAVKINDDPYGKAVVDYARAWVDTMDAEMDQDSGVTVADIAKRTSHDADTDGITGCMYGFAVSIISQVWVHGEELRQWHNLDVQLHDEGEQANRNGGTLNPAMLNVG